MDQEVTFDVVALEREDVVRKMVIGGSGLMINRNFVITTSNIIITMFDNIYLEKLYEREKNKLHTDLYMPEDLNLKVFWKEDIDSNKYFIKNGDLLGVFISSSVQLTPPQTFDGWAVDTLDNSYRLNKYLSLFFVFKTRENSTSAEFLKMLKCWWREIRSINITQCDDIIIKSSSFGNKVFWNSFSKGIISNIVGNNRCLVVSDCPTTPGSEGSPVYKSNSSNFPFGIVLSSSTWWRREWTGLTLILDIRVLIEELLQYGSILKTLPNDSVSNLKKAIETSFVQVYCGRVWGTAVILDNQNGILLTNAHVVNKKDPITIWWKNRRALCTLIYKVTDEVFDLAVLKCKRRFLFANKLHAIDYKEAVLKSGDEVYAVGYSIFSKETICEPTVSRGNIISSTESMLLTTCCVNSGMSGGGVLDKMGKLVGVIVSNTKIQQTVYSRHNMAIPFSTIRSIIERYLQHYNASCLVPLSTSNVQHRTAWLQFEAKL